MIFFSQKLEVALHNLAGMLSKFDEVYHNFRFEINDTYKNTSNTIVCEKQQLSDTNSLVNKRHTSKHDT